MHVKVVNLVYGFVGQSHDCAFVRMMTSATPQMNFYLL